MCPFLDDEDCYSSEHLPSNISNTNGARPGFLRSDKKFFIIGCTASVVAFCIVACVMYSNTKPIDLEELPIIHAENTPFKVKPKNNDQEVKHQDKIVYDNISGDQRKVDEKIAPKPEEIISIPEIEAGSLSDEEKKNIISSFDDLAPKEPHKINYEKKNIRPVKEIRKNSDELAIVENNPPIKVAKKHNAPKQKLKDFVDEKVVVNEAGGYMVQIASVSTKSAADAEYNRIASKNKFLKQLGKKIVKVDLGKNKGIKYRVQVGPFKSIGDANNVVSTMGHNGFSAYITK